MEEEVRRLRAELLRREQEQERLQGELEEALEEQQRAEEARGRAERKVLYLTAYSCLILLGWLAGCRWQGAALLQYTKGGLQVLACTAVVLLDI